LSQIDTSEKELPQSGTPFSDIVLDVLKKVVGVGSNPKGETSEVQVKKHDNKGVVQNTN
jgi:hypothetical protein